MFLQGGTNPGGQVTQTDFVQWHILFVDPQYGTCFLSSFWHINFKVAHRVLEKLWNTDLLNMLVKSACSEHLQRCTLLLTLSRRCL
jgi:hypothetical protein